MLICFCNLFQMFWRHVSDIWFSSMKVEKNNLIWYDRLSFLERMSYPEITVPLPPPLPNISNNNRHHTIGEKPISEQTIQLCIRLDNRLVFYFFFIFWDEIYLHAANCWDNLPLPMVIIFIAKLLLLFFS